MANLVLALASSNKSTKLLPYYFSKKELVFKSRNKKGIISWFLKIFFNPKEITGSSPIELQPYKSIIKTHCSKEFFEIGIFLETASWTWKRIFMFKLDCCLFVH